MNSYVTEHLATRGRNSAHVWNILETAISLTRWCVNSALVQIYTFLGVICQNDLGVEEYA